MGNKNHGKKLARGQSKADGGSRAAIAMHHRRRDKGCFGFDYSDDALREIDGFFKFGHTVIVSLTVREILDELLARNLA